MTWHIGLIEKNGAPDDGESDPLNLTAKNLLRGMGLPENTFEPTEQGGELTPADWEKVRAHVEMKLPEEIANEVSKDIHRYRTWQQALVKIGREKLDSLDRQRPI